MNGNISRAAVSAPYSFQKYSGRIIQPDFDSSRQKKRSAVWQNTFVQSCHLQQQRFAALYFVVLEYHGKSKEMITASVFRITGADNSIIQQKTCKAKLYRFFGTPEGTRTPDLLVRSQSLYPTELPAHTTLSSALQYNSTHALKMQALFWEILIFLFALPLAFSNLEQYAPFSHVAQKRAQKFVGFGGQNFFDGAWKIFMRHL